MVNNQNNIESDEYNNLSEYERIWNEIRNKINVTAKDYVKPLYEALIKEGYDPKEARDKIKKDAFNIWAAKTIDDHIPTDAKDTIKVIAGQLGQEKKKEKNVLPQSEAEQSPVSQIKPNLYLSKETVEVEEPKPISINELEIVMSKKDAHKFMNELRIDVMGRMSANGSVKFKMTRDSLTYTLI